MRRMTQVVAVALAKGGTGKTTTTVNLAGALARLGARVLVVDLDPQGDAGAWLGLDAEGETILDALELGLDLEDVAQDTRIPGVSAVLASDRLDVCDQPEGALGAWLERISSQDDAPHVVLLDCAPGWIWSTRAAAAASRWLLVPTKPDPKSMRGASAFVRRVIGHGLGFANQLEILGVFLNGVVKGRVSNREARRALMEGHEFGDRVMSTQVHSWVATEHAERAKTSVYELGAQGSKAARDYSLLARELGERGLTWE